MEMEVQGKGRERIWKAKLKIDPSLQNPAYANERDMYDGCEGLNDVARFSGCCDQLRCFGRTLAESTGRLNVAGKLSCERHRVEQSPSKSGS